MKKTLLFALVLIMMAFALCAVAEEEESVVSYFGAVMYDVPEESKTIDIRTRHEGMYGFYLTLPEEGPAAAEFSRKGIRFTLAEPVPEGGFDWEAVAMPTSLEMLGLISGAIVEIDEDYIVSYVYEKGAVVPDAPTVRLALDENTHIMSEFKVGDAIYIIYDEETELVYEIWNSNG